MERARSLVDATEAHLLVALERRGVCDEEFGLTTKAWVAHHANVSPAFVAARVRTALRLGRHFEEVDAAVTAGDLS